MARVEYTFSNNQFINRLHLVRGDSGEIQELDLLLHKAGHYESIGIAVELIDELLLRGLLFNTKEDQHGQVVTSLIQGDGNTGLEPKLLDHVVVYAVLMLGDFGERDRLMRDKGITRKTLTLGNNKYISRISNLESLKLLGPLLVLSKC